MDKDPADPLATVRGLLAAITLSLPIWIVLAVALLAFINTT